MQVEGLPWAAEKLGGLEQSMPPIVLEALEQRDELRVSKYFEVSPAGGALVLVPFAAELAELAESQWRIGLTGAAPLPSSLTQTIVLLGQRQQGSPPERLKPGL